LNEDKPIETFTIWDSYWDIMILTNTCNKLVNYDLPINKINTFIKANYTYTGDYTWQRTSNALSQIQIEGIDYNLGNTIQMQVQTI
jgi:cell surface protein SprA